jgi:hypothetical protein
MAAMSTLQRASLVGAALVALAPGCRREEVTHTRVPAEAAAPPASAPGGPTAEMPAGAAPAADLPAPPRPEGSSALAWTLPAGWTESRGSGMRYATLTPPGAGRIDVSVVVLPGPAGGELANVNRWRGQIGMPALDDGALAAARKTIRTRAGQVSLYDFESDGSVKTRMVAGLLSSGGNTWFLKMSGDAGAVNAARPGFMGLLESLRRE